MIFLCHSEGALRPKNLKILRFAQDDKAAQRVSTQIP